MKVKVKIRNKTALMSQLLLNGKISLQEIPLSERLNNGLRYYACAYRYYRRQPKGVNPLEILAEDIKALPNGSPREVLQQYLEASNAMSVRRLDNFF